MRNSPVSRAEILARVLASLLGGYGFVWGFSVLGIALLVAAGMEFPQASTLVMLLAFLVFLVLFCWSFTAASVLRVWVVLAGGGVAMTLLGWQLARQIA
jgi:ABC-type transport system involved in multi-copper enzyme maturation permease subunit